MGLDEVRVINPGRALADSAAVSCGLDFRLYKAITKLIINHLWNVSKNSEEKFTFGQF